MVPPAHTESLSANFDVSVAVTIDEDDIHKTGRRDLPGREIGVLAVIQCGFGEWLSYRIPT